MVARLSCHAVCRRLSLLAICMQVFLPLNELLASAAEEAASRSQDAVQDLLLWMRAATLQVNRDAKVFLAAPFNMPIVPASSPTAYELQLEIKCLPIV